MCFFFFKQKTAYEIYQCDWSSDVCSSDLVRHTLAESPLGAAIGRVVGLECQEMVISLQ